MYKANAYKDFQAGFEPVFQSTLRVGQKEDLP